MKNRLFIGVFTLSAATVLCKVIGAFYRVPLTAVLGEEGLGLYQMAFPTYCILLTLSSTGIPSALSKMIAEGKNARAVLKKALFIFGGAGLFFSLALFVFAADISRLQGNELAAEAYRALSPSVFVVSVISCLRGYCQGKNNMLPTALSQVTEQIAKLAFGLTLCTFFGSTSYEKASLATLSVTISEVAALIVTLYLYKKTERGGGEDAVSVKSIMKVVLPVTLSSIVLPLSRAVDGFLIINLLKDTASGPTALFGLYSGACESVIALPVALCYAIAVSSIPTVSADKNDIKKRVEPVWLTILICSITGLLTYLLSKPIVNILYFSLSEESRIVLETLIKVSAAQVIGLATLQTLGAILISVDKLFVPCAALFCGAAVKVFLTIRLVAVYGIYGAALSDSVIYLSVALAELAVLTVLSARTERGRKGAVLNAADKNIYA